MVLQCLSFLISLWLVSMDISRLNVLLYFLSLFFFFSLRFYLVDRVREHKLGGQWGERGRSVLPAEQEPDGGFHPRTPALRPERKADA